MRHPVRTHRPALRAQQLRSAAQAALSSASAALTADPPRAAAHPQNVPRGPLRNGVTGSAAGRIAVRSAAPLIPSHRNGGTYRGNSRTSSAGWERSHRPPPVRTAAPPCGAPGRAGKAPLGAAARRTPLPRLPAPPPPRGSHHPLTSFCALGLTPSASSRRKIGRAHV